MRITLYAPQPGTPHTPESLSDIIRGSDADFFAGSEYLLFSGDRRRMYPLDNEERRAYLDAFCAASRDRIVIAPMLWTDGRLFYNSAPIVHDGRIAGERYKWHAAQSERLFSDLWGMHPGRVHSKPIVHADSIRLRVDLCLDFAHIGDRDEADIHLLCASGYHDDLPKSGKWRVRDGGNALVVDEYFNAHGDRMAAWRRVQGTLIPYLSRRSTSTMSIYEVDL